MKCDKFFSPTFLSIYFFWTSLTSLNLSSLAAKQSEKFFNYLHNRTRGEDFFLHLRFFRRSTDSRKISHNIFGRHRFSSPRLSRYDDTLVFLFAVKKFSRWNVSKVKHTSNKLRYCNHLSIRLYASSAMANICGSNSPTDRPLYVHIVSLP